MFRARAGTCSVIIALTAAAFLLRLYGLEARSLSHPEVYIPGIKLIAGHSVPEPRYTLAETLWMHFHDEPHPIGWYLAMFGWTSLFGTSEFALRLPSAILGAAAVPLMFLLGRRVFGTAVGLAAAAVLALHGFHIFWSQSARMYVTGGFLSILATILLLRLALDRDAGRGTAVGYVATLVAGVSTVELFWPFIGVHILWAFLMLPEERAFRLADLVTGRFGGAHRVVQLQAVALMLSAPELLHGVYRARKGAASDPSLEWLREYLTFGFLYRTDDARWDPLTIGPVPGYLLMAGTLVLLFLASRSAGRECQLSVRRADVPQWLATGLAAAASTFMVWLASIAHHRNEALMVVAAGPVLALMLPTLSAAFQVLVRRLALLDAWRLRVNGQVVLIWLLAVLAPLIIFAASFIMSLLANRAFLVFVPYLLLLLTAPFVLVPQTARRKAGSVAVLLLLLVPSVPYSWQMPGSPRDYKSLAVQMKPLMRPDDLVFVRDKRWEEAPLIYYLPEARYVFSDYAAALRSDPMARVWLVTWPSRYVPVVTDERREALAGYVPDVQVTSLRASGELFLPRGR